MFGSLRINTIRKFNFLLVMKTDLQCFFVDVQNLHMDLDTDGYKLCIDYLTDYGSHYQHVLFVNKQRSLRDAITTFRQMVTSLAASCSLSFARRPNVTPDNLLLD